MTCSISSSESEALCFPSTFCDDDGIDVPCEASGAVWREVKLCSMSFSSACDLPVISESQFSDSERTSDSSSKKMRFNRGADWYWN